MQFNNNQKAIRKGYATIAKNLGSVMGVYRPSDHKYAPALDPKNWLFDIPFSAATSSGFQGTMKEGVPAYQGFFDSTDIEPGDIFHNDERTFYVGDIPLFEPPMVIECFNCFSVFVRQWDRDTRTHVDTIIVNEVPCNVQDGSEKAYSRDGESFSNDDYQPSWTIRTYLKDGIINLNDKVVLDNGKKGQVFDLFRSQHGLIIKVMEILGDGYTDQ